MTEYDTPSGGLKTALDKFVHRYTLQGYNWRFCNDDIVFSKPESELFAKAKFNSNGWINGYDVSVKRQSYKEGLAW